MKVNFLRFNQQLLHVTHFIYIYIQHVNIAYKYNECQHIRSKGFCVLFQPHSNAYRFKIRIQEKGSNMLVEV